jgi:hypothetical protein
VKIGTASADIFSAGAKILGMSLVRCDHKRVPEAMDSLPGHSKPGHVYCNGWLHGSGIRTSEREYLHLDNNTTAQADGPQSLKAKDVIKHLVAITTHRGIRANSY